MKAKSIIFDYRGPLILIFIVALLVMLEPVEWFINQNSPRLKKRRELGRLHSQIARYLDRNEQFSSLSIISNHEGHLIISGVLTTSGEGEELIAYLSKITNAATIEIYCQTNFIRIVHITDKGVVRVLMPPFPANAGD